MPNSLRHGIVTTYHQERVDAEGPRFSAEIRALMEEHGLAYSILNLEKVKAEYFKARADVLLNTQERYLIEFPAEQVELNVVEALPSVTVVDVPEKPHPVSPPQPQQIPIPEPVSMIAPVISALPGINLPVKHFMKQCELLIANNHENWNEDTAKDVRTIVRIFIGILTEHNVLTSSGIDQTHLAALRQHFNNILPDGAAVNATSR